MQNSIHRGTQLGRNYQEVNMHVPRQIHGLPQCMFCPGTWSHEYNDDQTMYFPLFPRPQFHAALFSTRLLRISRSGARDSAVVPHPSMMTVGAVYVCLHL